MNWSNIDLMLPRLPYAFDSNAMLNHFAQQPASAPVRQPFTRWRRQSVDYIPAKRCTTTYLLTDEAAVRQTIGVVEVDPAGIEYRFFTDDPQLANLSMAIDVDRLAAQFAAQHAELGQIDTVVPIRYKPGSRCTLRYHMHTNSSQSHCFGKLLAQNSAEIAQAVDDLYRASQKTTELPGIARPLAYWPKLQMLVQEAVVGEELHNLAFDPQCDLGTRINWMRSAGRATAALHTTTTDAAGPQQTVLDDLAALNEYEPALRQLDPQLAYRFNEAIATVGEIERQQDELAPVLSHGALRTDQFMIENGHLVLIDLDSLCWSSPARDVGNFLAYLTWKALRQPQYAAFIQLGQQSFLAGYQTFRPLPDAHWITLYQVASMLKIIGRRYTGLTYREWPLTATLLDIATSMIQV